MSDTDESPRSFQWNEERARRLNALRELANEGQEAQQGEDSPLTREPLPHTRRRKPRWYAVLAVVAAIAVIGILFAHNQALITQTHVQHRDIISIVPAADGLQCAQDVAWSPKSQQIAVIGYYRFCASDGRLQYTYEPGVVAVYDAASGKLVSKFQPDSLIIPALGLKPPSFVTPAVSSGGDASQQVIEYSQIAWSPDGTRLALPFIVGIITDVLPNGVLKATTIRGLLLTDSQGIHGQVLSHVVTGDTAYSGEWDISSGSYVPAPVGATLSTAASDNWGFSAGLAMPAVGYTWGSQGTLSSQTSLSARSAPAITTPSAIGNPDGGQAFSMWQSGEYQALVGRRSGGDSTQIDVPGAYTFTTSFVAWSPDGRYVLSVYAHNWRIQPRQQPAPSSQALGDLSLRRAPILPVRDAAQEAVLDSTPISDPHTGGGALLDWSPDGRVLAVQPSDMGNSETPAPIERNVRMYDTSTGKLVATLTPSASTQGQLSASYLRWSPDGKQFLLLDDTLGTITIWGPSKLPPTKG